MKPAVVVVDPETPGNVGTIARSMKNFGFEDLLLVNPPVIEEGDEAHGFAGRAREDVLKKRRQVSFDEVIENYYTVGFTAVTTQDPTNHRRNPFVTLEEVLDELESSDTGQIALVFGRERVGLKDGELSQLDRVCSIPASSEYPVLNLGQSATIALYELRDLALEETQHPDEKSRSSAKASGEMTRKFYDEFSVFLREIDHPEEKRDEMETAVRRILGRAHPTEPEMRKLFGLLRRTSRKLDSG